MNIDSYRADFRDNMLALSVNHLQCNHSAVKKLTAIKLKISHDGNMLQNSPDSVAISLVFCQQRYLQIT